MGDCMTFPETFEEFAEQYKIVDTEEVYTNGTELIPIFRVEQWLEHQGEKEEKHECVIGLVCTHESVFLTTLEELKKHVQWQKKLWSSAYDLSDYFNGVVGYAFEQFKFCPLCGKKIDWKAIKKEGGEG